MARVDIRQHTGMPVVLRPKETRVAIVSEAAGELLIKYFNEMGGRRSRAVNAIAELRPCDCLQVRHHESCRNSFAAHVRTQDPNSFRAKIEEIVQIATDCSRRQGSA